MPNDAKFLLDANVFIEAHRRYYAFDLCPGFWGCLPHYFASGRLISIDRIRAEILSGDELETWIQTEAPQGLFASTSDLPVIHEFTAMMAWVQAQVQFSDSAKAEFAQVADGWLAAYAKAHGYTLVTHEEYRVDARRRVPLPNVCHHFGVPYVNTFAMLRNFGTKFGWALPV